MAKRTQEAAASENKRVTISNESTLQSIADAALPKEKPTDTVHRVFAEWSLMKRIAIREPEPLVAGGRRP